MPLILFVLWTTSDLFNTPSDELKEKEIEIEIDLQPIDKQQLSFKSLFGEEIMKFLNDDRLKTISNEIESFPDNVPIFPPVVMGLLLESFRLRDYSVTLSENEEESK